MDSQKPALAVLLAALLGACGGFVDEDEGEVPTTEIPFDLQETIKLHKGYLDEKRVEYYRFGSFVPSKASWFPSYDEFPGMPVHPIYIWAGSNGKPSVTGEQHPIIDTLPMQAKYTDFFEVVVVSAGEEQPNDIKSRGTLLLADLELKHTGHVINCPVVGKDAQLQSSPPKTCSSSCTSPMFCSKAGVCLKKGQCAHHGDCPTNRFCNFLTKGCGFQKIKVWYRKKLTHCMLMEGGSALIPGGAPPPLISREPVGDRTEYRVSAGEVHTLRSSAFSGADLVSNILVPDNDIYRHGPTTKQYSPLTQVKDVTVPSDYKMGQLKSYKHLYPIGDDHVDSRIKTRSPEAFFNSSIVHVGKVGK